MGRKKDADDDESSEWAALTSSLFKKVGDMTKETIEKNFPDGALATITEKIKKETDSALKQLSKNAKDHQKRVDAITKKNNRRYGSSGSSMSEAFLTVFLPGRALSIVLGSFVLAEVADRLGLLDDPKTARAKLQQVWQNARQTSWKEWQRKADTLWKQVRGSVSRPSEHLSELQPKHQLAIGMATGWIVSPVMWSLASAFLKATIVCYASAEINYQVLTRKGKSLIQKLDLKLVDSIGPSYKGANVLYTTEEYLERLRLLIRNNVWKSNPKQMVQNAQTALNRYEPPDQTTFPLAITPSTKWGVILGLGTGFLL